MASLVSPIRSVFVKCLLLAAFAVSLGSAPQARADFIFDPGDGGGGGIIIDPGGGGGGGGGGGVSDFECGATGLCGMMYMPASANQGEFDFNFPVTGGVPVVIDPIFAIGYDYSIGAGDPNFASVKLPTGIGDNHFELYLFNATLNDFVLETALDGGVLHTFAIDGVDRFRVLGIEISAGLDPTNGAAFQTEVTFTGSGQFTGSMAAITAEVPEPSTAALLYAALCGLLPGLRRSRAKG